MKKNLEGLKKLLRSKQWNIPDPVHDYVDDLEAKLRETPLYRFKGESWEEFGKRLAKKIKEILGET